MLLISSDLKHALYPLRVLTAEAEESNQFRIYPTERKAEFQNGCRMLIGLTDGPDLMWKLASQRLNLIWVDARESASRFRVDHALAGALLSPGAQIIFSDAHVPLPGFRERKKIVHVDLDARGKQIWQE